MADKSLAGLVEM